MDNDNPVFLPVNVRAYGSKIFGLSQIIKREIDGVVYMAEFIDIIETQLYGQGVVKLNFFRDTCKYPCQI